MTVTSVTDVFAFGVGAVTVEINFSGVNDSSVPIITENARTTVFLCLHCNSAGMHLHSPSLLVCGLDGLG